LQDSGFSCSARARSFALRSASSLLGFRVMDRRPGLSYHPTVRKADFVAAAIGNLGRGRVSEQPDFYGL